MLRLYNGHFEGWVKMNNKKRKHSDYIYPEYTLSGEIERLHYSVNNLKLIIFEQLEDMGITVLFAFYDGLNHIRKNSEND